MENELDCTLSITSTPVPTSDYSSGSGAVPGRVARIIKKNLRRNQGRSRPKVSLADRIKHFRQNRDFSEENSRGASVCRAPSDLHSLVCEYRDVLSQESDLSTAVLNSISDAKYTNQQINSFFSKSTSPVPHRRVLQGSVGSDSLLTVSPDTGNVSRRRIFQENDWSRNQIRSPNMYTQQQERRRGRYDTLSQYQEGRSEKYDSKNRLTLSPENGNGAFLPAVIGSVGVTQSISRSTKDDRIFPTIETSNRLNDAPQIQSTAVGSLKSLTKSLDSLPTEYPRTNGSDAHLSASTISGTGCETYPEVHCPTRSTETLEDRHSVSTGPSSWTQTVESHMSRSAAGRRRQGNRYMETVQKEFTRRKYQSPSFLLNHWLDVADDSYEKVLSEFSRPGPATKTIATQTSRSDNGTDTHSTTEHGNIMKEQKQGSETIIIKDDGKQNVHSHASLPEPIPTVSSVSLPKRRQMSTNSNNKTYSFINVSFNRSLSLPNMTKCSTQNADHLRKNYTDVDIETLLNQTNWTMTTRKAMIDSVVFPPISQTNKAYHRSKDPLPITRTNLASRRLYLRSNSCGDIVKTVDKQLDTPPPSRLIGLYKDLGSLGCFLSDKDILKMTLRKRNYQMLDVKVTWRSKVSDDILILYRDHVVISDRFKHNKTQHMSKQRKKFIYQEDVPIRNTHSISASDKDTKRFMNMPVQNGHKQATCRMPPVYKGNRKCVPKQMCRALYDQTRHHFVPWK